MDPQYLFIQMSLIVGTPALMATLCSPLKSFCFLDIWEFLFPTKENDDDIH